MNLTFKQFLAERAVDVDVSEIVDALWDAISTNDQLLRNHPSLATINQLLTKAVWKKYEVSFKQSTRASSHRVLKSIAREHQVGLDGADVTLNTSKVVVYTTYNAVDALAEQDTREEFVDMAASLIAHEFVHRGQFDREHAKTGSVGGGTVDVSMADMNARKYFSNQHEIMAFARGAAQELRSRLSVSFIMKMLRSSPKELEDYSDSLRNYTQLFKSNERPYKYFFRYLVDYLAK